MKDVQQRMRSALTVNIVYPLDVTHVLGVSDLTVGA
jgi:hypothetical protein